jgi:hypothetical protein
VNAAEICRRSGATLLADGSVSVKFLNADIIIDINRRAVDSSDSPLQITDKLIILHYLVGAQGNDPAGELVSFKDLPGGAVYYPTFLKRAVAPVVGCFGEHPEALFAAASALGGNPAAHGDAAVCLRALPRVALWWILWRGDNDFPAEGSILFDKSIADYLPTEDVAVLCQSVSGKLCVAKDGQPSPGGI